MVIKLKGRFRTQGECVGFEKIGTGRRQSRQKNVFFTVQDVPTMRQLYHQPWLIDDDDKKLVKLV